MTGARKPAFRGTAVRGARRVAIGWFYDKFIVGTNRYPSRVSSRRRVRASVVRGRRRFVALELRTSPSLERRCVLITAIHKCGQATKGVWWMPRRAEAMKDAAGCDKLRGAAKQALIRRCPNGATRHHWATFGVTGG